MSRDRSAILTQERFIHLLLSALGDASLSPTTPFVDLDSLERLILTYFIEDAAGRLLDPRDHHELAVVADSYQVYLQLSLRES